MECPVCKKKKGDRKCRLYVHKMVCSKCCAIERHSPVCDPCRYYRQASQYKQEKQEKEIVGKAGGLELFFPHVYRLVEKNAQQLPGKLGDLFTIERLHSTIEMVERKEKMGIEVFDLYTERLRELEEKDYIEEITFEERELEEVLEENDLSLEDMMLGESRSKEDEDELEEEYKDIIMELISNRKEVRETFVLDVLERFDRIDEDFGHETILFLLMFLNRLLNPEQSEMENLIWHPLVFTALNSTLVMLFRREDLVGKRRHSKLWTPDRDRSLYRPGQGIHWQD